MNAITFPLMPQTRSPGVADLQAALLLLFERRRLLADDDAAPERLSDLIRQEGEQQLFGEVTQRAVSAFQQQHQLGSSGEVDRATADAFNRVLRELGVLAEPASAPALHGRLLSERGLPAAGATLRVYAPGFGGRLQSLAEVRTDDEGRYRVDQPLPVDVRLRVHLVGRDGAEIPLDGTAQRLPRDRPVSFIAATEQLPIPAPEFSRLMAGLRPHLADAPLAQAQENDQRQDLTLLHEASGWDARLIALAASAESLAESTGAEAEALYALFRVGLPQAPMQLARLSRSAVGQALAKANQAGLVALDDQQMRAAEDALDSFGRKQRRKLAMVGSASSYGAMLAASGLDDAEQERFDGLFSAHDGDAASLWQKVDQAGLPTDRLRLSAQLGVLTLNNARLVESLREQIGSSERLAEALVSAQFHRAETWQQRLHALSDSNERLLGKMIPPAYVGDSVAERLQAYSRDLAHKVRRSFPMQVLAERLRRGESERVSDDPAVRRDLATVLDRAATAGYRLGQQSTSRFLSTHRQALFDGVPADRVDGVSTALKALCRQYQITLSDAGLDALQQAGLRSAHDVAVMPQRMFLAQHGGKFPSTTEARLTWQRAQQVNAVTLDLATRAKQLGSARMLPAMARPSAEVEAAHAALVKQYPTLESLFGALDFCECAHCQSVLSPAAYLVDLLKMLDEAPASPQTPYQALTERRPDIPHLRLSCENTFTVLPYIDIVNELLEFYLIHGEQLSAAAAFDTGDADSADLIAEPQNLLPDAYDLLKAARYPLTAPFDLWLATVRGFTAHFEVPFWQLLEAMRPTDALHPPGGEAYGYAAVAYERLGVSPAELALLSAGASLTGWGGLFGISGDPLPQLASAQTLARKLDVSYHELVALLRTRLVNPDGALRLVDDVPDGQQGSPCSWAFMTLRRADGAAKPLDFVLLNYLVRVWRRLRWPLDEVDLALTTFLPRTPAPRSASTIGPAMASALLGMAHLARLAEQLKAGSGGRCELLVLWAPIDDRRYAELFLTGSAQTRDPVFEGTPGSYLSAAGVLLTAHRASVLAALQLSSDELDRILADAGLPADSVQLTLDLVSRLYRHALLARQLKISIADLLLLRTLSGLDPFAPLAAGPVTDAADDQPYRQTLRFVAIVQALRETALSVADLDYLLRHRFDPVGPYRSASQPPLALIRALAAAIERIRDEHAVPADASSFSDEAVGRALALVLAPALVAACMDAWIDPAVAIDAALFDQHLLRRSVAGVGELGFLAAADRAPLFDTAPADQAADTERRRILVSKLLPYVQQRLIQQAIVAAVAAELGADPALLLPLLTRAEWIADPQQPSLPLLPAYQAAASRGLSISADRVSGYLEVPVAGSFQLQARCATAGVALSLRFDHLHDPLLVATSSVADLTPHSTIELKAGVPYGFTLQHSAGAEVALWIVGQTLPATPVSALVTLRRTEVDALQRRHQLLAKAVLLADRLPLSEVELRHVLSHRDDFDGIDFSGWPTTDAAEPPAAARARFGQVMRLVGYVQLRDQLAAAPQDLVDVLQAARRRLPAGADPAAAIEQLKNAIAERFAALTRRDPLIVRATIDRLGFAAAVVGDQVVAPALARETGLARLWRVLSLAHFRGFPKSSVMP